MSIILLSFILCALVGIAVIPVLCKLARRMGLVDNPDKTRKLHTEATPLVGGIGFALSLLLVTPLVIFLGQHFSEFFISIDKAIAGVLPFELPLIGIGHIRPIDVLEYSGLVISGLLLLAVGVIDDWKGIRGRQKLAGQILAATILIAFGYEFHSVGIAGFTFKFGFFSVFMVYIWVLAAVNSVNLLDGADGIAASIGIIMSVALGVMLVAIGKGIDAVVVFGLAGSLAAVLYFNFPPAKIYLGDAGSMLIGFLLAAVAIRSTFKQNSLYAFMAPATLLAIPFIDTGAAIIRRRLTGRSIFAVDRGHLHHELLKKGYSPLKSLVWVILFSGITAVGAVVALLYRKAEFALAAVVLVFIMMAGARLFGFAELKLVTHKTNNLLRTAFHGDKNAEAIQDSVYHVQGDRNWDHSWKKLRSFAIDCGLLEMTLNLNAPWLHESYHAKMKTRDTVREANHMWNTSIPLLHEKKIFGTVEFSCAMDSQKSHRDIIKGVLDIAAEIESTIDNPPKAETEISDSSADPATIS